MNHEIKNPTAFSDQLRKYLPTDPNHADVFNPVSNTLINNDVFLREAIETLAGTTIAEMKSPDYSYGTLISNAQKLTSFMTTITGVTGAQTVGMEAIVGLNADTNVSSVITALNNKLISSVGAGYIGVDAISELSARNVQEALASLNQKFGSVAPISHTHTPTDIPTLQNHLGDKNNPHSTTKSHVGLGSVENYGIATQAEAEAGLTNTKYMTPLRVGNAIKHLNDHTGYTNNPHSVTKGQVGLGLVENYGISTQAEAEAGTSNAKYMTPLRVKEAIMKLSPPTTWTTIPGKPTTFPPSTHTHSKSDVGLDSVENYGIATQAEAEAGTSDIKYMTPLKVKQAVTKLAPAPTWSTITGKPTTFPPDSHDHTWASITGKPTTFSPATHSHTSRSEVGISTGTGAFPGNSTTKTVTHGLGTTPSFVEVVPSVTTGGNLGEVYITSLTSTTFTIGNTGSFTGAFRFMAVR